METPPDISKLKYFANYQTHKIPWLPYYCILPDGVNNTAAVHVKKIKVLAPNELRKLYTDTTIETTTIIQRLIDETK